MPEVSIIVPVYNSERFLERCINSILQQTFSDFEVILLDDGSTDNSYNVCLEFSNKDKRIKIIRLNHCGVATVRNEAVKVSNGKYLMFCDSDDYVEKNWVEDLYNAIRVSPREQLVVCGHNNKNSFNDNSTKSEIPEIDKNTVYPISDFFGLCSYGILFSLCDKIFKKSIIEKNNLIFDSEVTTGEDLIFVAEYIKYCEEILYVPTCSYNYMNNSVETITRKYNMYKYDSLKKMYYARSKVVAEKDIKKLNGYYQGCFYKALIDICNDSDKETKKKRIKYGNYILRDKTFRHTLKNSPKGYSNWKIRAILFLRNYRLLCLFHKVTQKP